MAVDEQRGTGDQAGIHSLGLTGVELDENETVPGEAVALRFGPELAQEDFSEFKDFENPIGGDHGLSSGSGIDQQNIFEFVRTGRQDGSTLVDFGGIEQVEDGKMLDGQDLVHAFEAQTALTVEEVRNVGLFEAGLVGEAKAG